VESVRLPRAGNRLILTVAVLAGVLGGFMRAWIGGRSFAPLTFRLAWLVPVALVPQWLAFYYPPTRSAIPTNLAAAILILSQLLLLIFAWCNRKQAGFWALGIGLALNLLVIVLNRGLMPISPETLGNLYPNVPSSAWQIGSRFSTKDVILPIAETKLWWLSDCLRLPSWIPYHIAFSIGDGFIAIGAFWLLWAQGGANIQVIAEDTREDTSSNLLVKDT
jgi:hypothetical protein